MSILPEVYSVKQMLLRLTCDGTLRNLSVGDGKIPNQKPKIQNPKLFAKLKPVTGGLSRTDLRQAQLRSQWRRPRKQGHSRRETLVLITAPSGLILATLSDLGLTGGER
jgi:hypothetical protein